MIYTPVGFGSLRGPRNIAEPTFFGSRKEGGYIEYGLDRQHAFPGKLSSSFNPGDGREFVFRVSSDGKLHWNRKVQVVEVDRQTRQDITSVGEVTVGGPRILFSPRRAASYVGRRRLEFGPGNFGEHPTGISRRKLNNKIK